MAITPNMLVGVEEGVARRVIAAARSIAPCIDSLTDPDAVADVLAILNGVAGESATRGSLHVVSERAGSVGVSYSTARSWFSSDDRAALRAFCPGASGPTGVFPENRFVQRVWPEGEVAP